MAQTSVSSTAVFLASHHTGTNRRGGALHSGLLGGLLFGNLLGECDNRLLDRLALAHGLGEGDAYDAGVAAHCNTHVEAILVKALHLARVNVPVDSDEMRDVILQGIRVVGVHVVHHWVGEGLEGVRLPAHVLVDRHGARARESPHKRHVGDLVHPVELKVLELSPVGAGVVLHVGLAQLGLVAPLNPRDTPDERHARVRGALELRLRDAKGCLGVGNEVLSVRGEGREDKEGPPLAVGGEPDDAPHREPLVRL
mmetsp:Transcript_17604/g.44308  ORF Transcript_17604/g.44308 Transcript_17604/m.44308 type:complete len:254 (+) Transcript_17604:204-965(+)